MPDAREEPEPQGTMGHLVASRTHETRAYTIKRAESPGQGEYQVVILQGGAKGFGPDAGTAYYLEEAQAMNFLGRRFLWVKLKDGECYETHVGTNWIEWFCTCKAGQVHRYLCKHAEVLWDCIHKGHLPATPLLATTASNSETPASPPSGELP